MALKLTDGFNDASHNVVTRWFSVLNLIESSLDAVPGNLSDGSGCLSVQFSL